MSRRAKFVIIPVVILAFVNFFSFIFIDLYLGGDALNGYARDGHYFLYCQTSHSRYIEVSRAVWTYSYWHAISVFVTHGLVFVSAAIFLNTGDMVLEKRAPMA
jgi:hypothetical protein